MSTPVISMWQPWSEWVAKGIKTTETRLHSRFASLKNRTIAIHATAKFDKDALTIASRYRGKLPVNYHEPAIVALAFVKDARWLDKAFDSKKALIDCYTVRRFGLILTDVCHVHIPCKGHQGIWYTDLV